MFYCVLWRSEKWRKKSEKAMLPFEGLDKMRTFGDSTIKMSASFLFLCTKIRKKIFSCCCSPLTLFSSSHNCYARAKVTFHIFNSQQKSSYKFNITHWVTKTWFYNDWYWIHHQSIPLTWNWTISLWILVLLPQTFRKICP